MDTSFYGRDVQYKLMHRTVLTGPALRLTTPSGISTYSVAGAPFGYAPGAVT